MVDLDPTFGEQRPSTSRYDRPYRGYQRTHEDHVQRDANR
jgi:hypothetical protein